MIHIPIFSYVDHWLMQIPDITEVLEHGQLDCLSVEYVLDDIRYDAELDVLLMPRRSMYEERSYRRW